jgi:hypothetical protein
MCHAKSFKAGLFHPDIVKSCSARLRDKVLSKRSTTTITPKGWHQDDDPVYLNCGGLDSCPTISAHGERSGVEALKKVFAPDERSFSAT